MQMPPAARVVVPSSPQLQEDVEFFKRYGFRLVHIYPSDDPQHGDMEGHGMQLALDRTATGSSPVLRITAQNPRELPPEGVSPGGCRVEVHDASRYVPASVNPTFEASPAPCVVPPDEPAWSVGRAGMLYRDLLPSRWGGAAIASHIRIERGGEVPDNVHFHDIEFQLIFCCRGWVRLVYEDQGPPFVLREGECVTQPPRIRHRVLEASDMLEVVEVGLPALHMTTLDWDMQLPTSETRGEREWDGQRFCRFRREEERWVREEGNDAFETCDTGVASRSGGAADVRVLRRCRPDPCATFSHPNHAAFSFVLQGTATLGSSSLTAAASFSVSPGTPYALTQASQDFRLLRVLIPCPRNPSA